MALDTRDIYVTALKNTHALEMQALQIMERQVERLQNYPEMEAALRRHIDETHGQRTRLEEALHSLAESSSALKEGFLGFVGNMMALGHAPAQDEILKNAYANHAFENFEIAAYTSLLAIGEAAGQQGHAAAFQQSLKEEEGMAAKVRELVRPTTLRYIELSTAGEKADR
ncbi:Protein YciE [Methylobacterium cerastii]|uniref:Protein YciE n=1 Tax=Methylobacterium cerastii TaxID=932741 RepID=A0ABQ4QNX3_9HYPH|nr:MULTISPECIES: ferritin-like domain-containing protein [Methylobacterium]TXM68370.1 ferritin-like domain-containing protein [Methylobacterium sp. WL12]TXN07267.1 ferritin-like domain-containing protein [Methylobacterium sp. WL122]TXN79457.1 ferritin-like domain-containing protein [Methylobacterium sp. WL8]GJD46510.1 Protein YciE [Methylobacterium cerastii]